jgi:hypothetical protein
MFLNSANSIKLNDKYNSYVAFNLQNNLKDIPNNVNTLISLTSFNCPKSFYNITNLNNELILNGTSHTITEGNYNAYTILSYLNAFNSNFVFTYNKLIAKITITSSIQNYTIDGTILKILGFSQAITATNYSLTSDQLVDMNGINNILLNIPSFSLNNNVSFESDAKNIIAVIPVDNGSYINYSNPNAIRYLFQEFDTLNLIIKITDINGNLINFHNHDWTIIINYEFIFRTEEPKEHINISQFYKMLEKKNNLIRVKTTNGEIRKKSYNRFI